MLQEQRQRQEKLESRNSRSSSSDTDTGKDVNGKRKRRRGNKNPKIECEIILMKQNTKYIQFPETINITKRYNDIIAMQQQQIERIDGSNEPQQLQRPTTKNKNAYEYATLVHFRNSANVMRDVDEKQLQYYIKDILRFDITHNNTNNNNSTTNSATNNNNNNDGDDPYGFTNKMLFNR